MVKFKIDEKIMNHLLYYKKIVIFEPLEIFLEYVEKIDDNTYEFVSDSEIEKTDMLSIIEIKLLNPEKINFNTANRIEIVFQGKNKNKYSQIWKCGRFFEILFKQIINTYISESALFTFISMILGSYVLSNIIKNENLKIVIDNNVSKYYDSRKYIKKSGSLSKSCMNDELHRAEFYDIIENVKIFAIINSSDKIFARALLWNTNKGLYLDRCYIIDDIFQAGVYLYATEHYNVKYNHMYEFLPEMKVQINEDEIYKLIEHFKSKIENLPYLDTFRFATEATDKNIYITNGAKYYTIEKILFDLYLNYYIKNGKKYISILSNYIDERFINNFILSTNDIKNIVDTFNIEYMTIEIENNPIMSGYNLSINTIPNVNETGKVQFFLEDAFEEDNYNDYSIDLKFEIMKDVNNILKNSPYNDRAIFKYIIFENQYDNFRESAPFVDAIDEIKNKIDVAYLIIDVNLMLDIYENLKNNKKNSVLIYVLNEFYVALNLKKMKYVLIRDMKNKFINSLEPGKLYHKSDIKNPYDKYMEKIFGNYSNLILFDLNVNPEIKKLKNEIVILNASFEDFIDDFLKYEEKLNEYLE